MSRSNYQQGTVVAVETMPDLATASYEQRFGENGARFVRRPVAISPPDGTVAFVDDGPREGRLPNKSMAVFRAGLWKPLLPDPPGNPPFDATHWTVDEELSDAEGEE